MYALCAWQYGGQLPYPGLNATGNPNSWSCNAAPAYISPPFTDPPAQPNPPAVSPPADNPPPQTNPPASGGTSGGSGGSGTTAPPRGSGAACDAPEPVRVGGQGQVTPGDANRMRSGAGLSYGQVGRIPAGGIFDVLGGPICADGYRWWQVRYNGTTGWTVDGDQEYWILEVSSPNSGGGSLQGSGGRTIPPYDLEPECEAGSSAQLRSRQSVRDCVERAVETAIFRRLTSAEQQQIWEVLNEVWQCGSQAVQVVLSFGISYYSGAPVGVSVASATSDPLLPDNVAACIVDGVHLVFGE